MVSSGGLNDCRVLVWDPARPGGGPLELGRHGDPPATMTAVAALPDGRVVSTRNGDGRVLMWDPVRPGGGPVELGRYHGGGVAVAALPDGRVVSGEYDGRVLVWDPARPQVGPVELGRHDAPVIAVAALPDGRAASGTVDGVLVWDVTTQTGIAQLGCSGIALATGPLGPSESSLVIAHRDVGFSLWSVTGGPQE